MGLLTDPLPLRWLVFAFSVMLVTGVASTASAQRYDCRDQSKMNALATDALVHADDPDTIGRIQGLSLQCDLEICEEPGAIRAFIEIMDLCVGAPDLEALYIAGAARMVKTGFFSDVTVERRKIAGGAVVTFVITGATLVRNIEFNGVWPVLESVVAKRLTLTRGRPFPPSVELVNEQEQAVVELYEERGFYGTRCRIIRKQIGRHLVDVEVKVELGRQLEVSRVVIGGQRVLSYGALRGLLLGSVGWFGSYSDSGLREGIRAVLAEYRRLGYFRARIVDKAVKKDLEAGSVQVFVEIDEGPHWEIIIAGNRAFTTEELSALTTFRESGYVDEVEIGKSVEGMLRYYEAAGYFFAKVKSRLSRTNADEFSLAFDIVEGVRGEVRSVEFKGNKTLSDEELQSVISTKPYALLASGGFLQRSQIEADLRSVVRAYRRRGYLQARAPVWQVRGEDNGESLFVTIEIEEGEPTVVSEVYLDGNKVLSNEDLREDLKSIRPGERLSLAGVRGDLARVIAAYEKRGYPAVHIRPAGSDGWKDAAECRVPGDRWRECRAPAFDAACFPNSELDREMFRLCTSVVQGSSRLVRCRRVRPDCVLEGGVQSSTVEVRLTIDEGPKLRVGSILIKGPFRTRPSVIRDEVPLGEGELFVLSKMYEGISNLRGLGLFESVSVDTIGLDEDEIRKFSESDRVAIIINVEEANARYTDFRVGGELRGLLDDQTSFVVTTEGSFTEANVFGYGKSFQLKTLFGVDVLEVGEVLDTATGELLEGSLPPLLDYVVATEIIWFDPRFVGGSQMTLTGFATLDLLGASNLQLDKEEFGARVSLTDKFLDRGPLERGGLPARLLGRLTVEQRRSTTRNRSDDPRTVDGAPLFEPRRDITKLSPVLTLDRRNSPLNPTRGYLVRVGVDYAIDFTVSPIEFLKFSARFSQFWTYFRTLTLGYGLRFGQVLKLGETQSVPEDELFYLGGYNSVRGYKENSLGPRNPQLKPTGGELLVNGHLELRFPFVRAWNLYGGYFFDAGILVDCLEDVSILDDPPVEPVGCYDDLSLEDIRSSAGVGVRWLIGGQIPVALDYGIALDRRVGEEFGALHLNLGYTF
jgi:outer membrane protein insertion porin family